MKKLLMVGAVLVASATAFAQTNVAVGGEVRMFEVNTKTGTTTSVNRMTSDESHFGFKGSEALGNGIKVNFNVDTFVTSNAPGVSTFGDRRSTLGVSNQLGSVDFGRKTTALYDVVGNVDPFGDRFGSVIGSIHNVQAKRLSNGVFVETATFAGFKGAYDFGQSNTAGVAGTTSASASYSALGGDVHYAYQGDKQTGAKTNLVGIGYTVPGVGTKVGFNSSNSYTASNSANTRGNSFLVAQNFGAWTAKGTYGESKTDNVADKTKAYSVGAVYNLSKRTAIEAAYSNVNAPGTAADVRTFGAGLTHAF